MRLEITEEEGNVPEKSVVFSAKESYLVCKFKKSKLTKMHDTLKKMQNRPKINLDAVICPYITAGLSFISPNDKKPFVFSDIEFVDFCESVRNALYAGWKFNPLEGQTTLEKEPKKK